MTLRQRIAPWVLRVGIFLLAALVAIVVVVAVIAAPPKDGMAAIHANPTATPTASATATPGACASTWPMTDTGNGSVKWWANGLDAIKNAKTDADAQAAADIFVNKAAEDAHNLKGAFEYFFPGQVVDATTLISNGCANSATIDLKTQLKLHFATAKITLGTAPSTGYNSSRNPVTGEVIGAAAPGVYGNAASRKAIQLAFPDGKTVWIMARCGNIVTTGPKPPPPPPPPKPVCVWNPLLPPDSPECRAPKVPSAAPDAKGHAQTGSGKPDVPGPGAPLTPVQPTATVVPKPPAPPAPDPTSSATPDPAPPAPVETALPTAPVTGCLPSPRTPCS